MLLEGLYGGGPRITREKLLEILEASDVESNYGKEDAVNDGHLNQFRVQTKKSLNLRFDSGKKNSSLFSKVFIIQESVEKYRHRGDTPISSPPSLEDLHESEQRDLAAGKNQQQPLETERT